MTVYVDADRAHELVTIRSIADILLISNYTPIRWLSKIQKTVETSTHGLDLVASRIAAKLILDVRFMLQSLGVDLDESTFLLLDKFQ
jgi:hypothetical protein